MQRCDKWAVSVKGAYAILLAAIKSGLVILVEAFLTPLFSFTEGAVSQERMFKSQTKS